jgi:hypothetical protein
MSEDSKYTGVIWSKKGFFFVYNDHLYEFTPYKTILHMSSRMNDITFVDGTNKVVGAWLGNNTSVGYVDDEEYIRSYKIDGSETLEKELARSKMFHESIARFMKDLLTNWIASKN